MKKLSLILVLTMLVMLFFSGCSDENNIPYANTGDPESYYICGFMEECHYNTKYIKITALEISNNYESVNTSNNTHYYVILSVNTNLIDSDFSNDNNSVELWLSSNEKTILNYVSWDANTGKLTYEISQNENLNYSELLNLKVSDIDSKSHQFPYVYMLLNVFDKICTVENTNYCGQYILLQLES